MKAKIIFHVGAVIVLAAVVAAAQSPKDKSKPGQPATSQDRQYSAPSVSERETGSGMATGKRQHQPVVISHEMAVDSTSTGHGPAQTATYESGVTTARETGSGMATGRLASPSDQDSGSPGLGDDVTGLLSIPFADHNPFG